jgi:hypothetical protein
VISISVFIVAVNVENSRIAVGKMFETVSHYSRVGTDVPGYHTNWAGGLATPIKLVGPGVQM